MAAVEDRGHGCFGFVQGSSQHASKPAGSCYITIGVAAAIGGTEVDKHKSMEGEGSKDTGKLQEQSLEEVVSMIPEEEVILKRPCALQTWTDPRPMDTNDAGKSKEKE